MGEQVAETFNFARDVMEEWARRRPHDPALWCVDEAGGARRYSFAELADRFRRASGFPAEDHQRENPARGVETEERLSSGA